MNAESAFDKAAAASGVWCWLPGCPNGRPGFYLFRRRFTLPAAAPLKLYVTGDNRFKLYLDGKLIEAGPVKSDLQHYQLHTVETETLPAGEHILSAELIVWESGWHGKPAPWSEMHLGGGFFLAGGAPGILDLSTREDGWQCTCDCSRRILSWKEASHITEPQPIVPAGPNEAIDCAVYPGDWRAIDFDDHEWQIPEVTGPPIFAGLTGGDPAAPIRLVPKYVGRQIREKTPVKEVSGCESVHITAEGNLAGVIPAGKGYVRINLGRNQTSMVKLAGHGGSGQMRLFYSERPPEGMLATHSDIITLAPKPWIFEPFELRAGQWFELQYELETPLTLDEVSFEFIHYDFGPFRTYSSPEDPDLEQIYQIGVHTALCCAHDTYEDCPYYERLQYGGDTRIQALISYEATGHGALGKKAILDLHYSRLPDGMVCSRYPDFLSQVIPGYSLIWVLMVEDYDNYFHDRELLEECRLTINGVLEYFIKRIEPETGIVGFPGYWDFCDWGDGWSDGQANRGGTAPETMNSLLMILALKAAANIADQLGFPAESQRWQQVCAKLSEAVVTHCLDRKRGLFVDVPGKEWVGKQTNALAVLADVAPAECIPAITAALIETDETVIPNCTLYFQFYVLEALRKIGDEAAFMKALSPWRTCLNQGLTTFPEVPSLSGRSWCHAWSAAPVYELLKIRSNSNQ